MVPVRAIACSQCMHKLIRHVILFNLFRCVSNKVLLICEDWRAGSFVLVQISYATRLLQDANPPDCSGYILVRRMWLHTCVCLWMVLWVSAYVCVCAWVSAYVCVCACVYVYVCVVFCLVLEND